MDMFEKLTILADSAKYDVACTSSGASRAGGAGSMGSALAPGLCHTFSGDGRCVTLLKVLLGNTCAYDCRYCVNRRSNDVPRAGFAPRELADLVMAFYRRNYIEGLFLSSAVLDNADNTVQQMIRCLTILRREYGFYGYIHAKAIPGADPALIRQLGQLCDRLSVNIELPSAASLARLAPEKSRESVLAPMAQIAQEIRAAAVPARRARAPQFAGAGQSTQMIVGASPESDLHILRLSEQLYRRYALKRVFFSAYVPVVSSSLLPAVGTPPPLLREHRLYQADWLLRFYHFSAQELLTEEQPDLCPYLDPKCLWALRNMHLFPLEAATAEYAQLLRVPGIGPKSARRIVAARAEAPLSFEALARMGVVLRRAQFFLLCNGRALAGMRCSAATVAHTLLDAGAFAPQAVQLSLFDDAREAQLAAAEQVRRMLA